MKKIKIYLITLLTFSGFLSCKKYVEVPPPNTELVGASVFNSNATAAAALNGIYLSMGNNSFGGGSIGLSIMPGLSADELGLFPGSNNPDQSQAYTNSLSSNIPTPCWLDGYNTIYQANAAIANIPASSGMTPAAKNQLLGEALFVRSFCYFYLVNFYGDVPLVTTINYKTNAVLPRAASSQVYQQITSDLKQAIGLLGDSYLTGAGVISTERVRPNKEAARALLARVYLYTSDWKDAVTQADSVINSSIYTINPNLNNVFLATSTEAIWQLETPVTSGSNTPDGAAFLLFPGLFLNYGFPPSASFPLLFLNSNLVQSFEPGDLRKANWIDSLNVNGTEYYYPFKYKVYYATPPPTEYPMMLRFAEQYLIRSEAEARLGQSGPAITDLNVIRTRAGLPNYNGATDNASMITAIMRERRAELFTENGARWFDLKRTGLMNSVMGSPGNQCAAKGGTWNPNWALYPIPLSDIQADPQMKQNPGYQ